MRDRNGNTLLHHSIIKQNVKFAQKLVDRSVSLHAQNNDQRTPLHLLCGFLLINPEGLAMLNTMISRYADVNAEDKFKNTPLHFLCSNASSETSNQATALTNLVNTAQAKVNVMNNRGHTPLYLACKNQKNQLIQRLLNAGANPHLGPTSEETSYKKASLISNFSIPLP